MATIINKRQQARNEKTLQQLLKKPGNGHCADCDARNPGWASWNLGVFLCMRCASLHRRIGTHVSRTKSLSMDTWSLDQVEVMKKNGNTTVNRRYNPKNTKPDIPLDVDAVSGVMEKFIREKYEHKTLCGEGRPLPSIRQRTGSSSGSSNDVGPPVPAKHGPRLSSTLRSSSAMYPTTQNALPSPPASDWSSNGSRKIFEIHEDSSIEDKLIYLKHLGFLNESRNDTILKGCNGDIFSACKTLHRLGEWRGEAAIAEHLQEWFHKPVITSGITIQPTGASHSSNGTSSGATLQQPAPTGSSSNNPFFRSQNKDQPAQPVSASAIEQSFQNFEISPQSQSQGQSQAQSLFPNNTGTWNAQRPRAPSLQNNPFLKTFTPPVSPSPYPYVSQQPSQLSSANPYLRPSQSQNLASSNPFGAMQQPQQSPSAMMPQATGWNQQAPAQPSIATQIQSPIRSQPTGYAQSPLSMQQMQSPQASFQQQQQVQSPQAFFQQQQPLQSPSSVPLQTMNPYAQQMQQQPQNYFHASQPQQQFQPMQSPQAQAFQQPHQYFQSVQQPQQSYPQQRQYYDKNSILALYNTPSVQPQATTQPQAQPQSPPHAQQRSVTMPILSNGTNPFGAVPPPATQQPPVASPGHVSRDSMAFMGGRSPSPDAFTGLSSRFM